ncbi:DNA-directed RNA polymerase subunit A'' [archaeon]|nr:MAG: DNA-directed RNA polymerase subunit A'' [archaeon]
MSEESQTSYSDKLPNKFMEQIEEVAKTKRLNKEQKGKLTEEVIKVMEERKFEPGEVIGIITAQSISEPSTQMTMRTYHFAGTAGMKVTYGLPRLMEIFDAKKELETPMMTILLKKDFNNVETAKKLAEYIVEKKLAAITKSVSLNLNDMTIEVELTDKKRENSVAKIIKEFVKDVDAKPVRDKIVITPRTELDIKELQKVKDKAMNVKIEGISGVQNAVVRREGEDWIINTIGTDLDSVIKLKDVDEKRTISNDIYEVAKVFGIEAARNVIMVEALKTLQEQGLDVDVRYIMLVGDIMTFSGEVNSIGRYGVAGSKTSILARAAFEETIKHLVRASIRNEADEFKGIFENVMIGQVIPSGTGMFDLIAKREEQS